jgi:hypothetical protein
MIRRTCRSGSRRTQSGYQSPADAVSGVRVPPRIYPAVEGLALQAQGGPSLYTVLGPFFPVLNRLFPNQVTTTVRIGRAMIRTATTGCSNHVLETRDIHTLAMAGDICELRNTS